MCASARQSMTSSKFCAYEMMPIFLLNCKACGAAVSPVLGLAQDPRSTAPWSFLEASSRSHRTSLTGPAETTPCVIVNGHGRWTHQEFVAGCAEGLRIFAFQVEDKFTEYGLVVVAILDGATIRQFVMSCRVIGLGVEEAAIAEISREITKGGAAQIQASYIPSKANYLCKDLFEKTGFRHEGDVWVRPAEPCATVPAHIRVKSY